MKKILLSTLNTKYVHSNLALRYLYSVCVETREALTLREFTINNEDAYVFGEIVRGEYDIICFSCYIWNIERILVLAETIKQADPDTIILLGGPEATFQAQELMKRHRSIDLILAGEGEENFPKLLELMSVESSETPEEIDLSAVRGLLYRRDGKIYQNPPALPVDFNLVPFPYRTLISEPDRINYYESARGCPFHCSYCLSCNDDRVRALSTERVKEDLSYFVYKNVKQVKFVDRTFNYNNDRAMEIFRYLMDTDNGTTNFHFEICGELLEEDILSLLENARPGLFQFEIGMQSTNPDTLEAVGRKGDYRLLAKAVEALKSYGNIHLHLDLIASLPKEDYQSFRLSFNDAYRLKPDHLQLGFLKLLPGTPIREEAAEHDYIYRRQPPYEVISNRYLSALSLVRLKMVEKVLDLYYNRGGFSNTLDYGTVTLAEDPFGFFEELADFFYLKGFQHKSHSKEDLYRIFRQYGRWKDRSSPGTEYEVDRLLLRDMEQTMNAEAIKNFLKKGWDPQG
jgi:radical SAM superfamily enzyme YgiQ (UPF0313 family)